MPMHRKLPYPHGRKGWGAPSSDSPVRDGPSPSGSTQATRCAYCRGSLAAGEARTISQGGETRYVHDRHAKRENETGDGRHAEEP